MKPHPKNANYYSDLPADKYAEVKRSIEIHGVRDPLKVLPDYTVVAGHQRLRIALELGLERVPVQVVDVSPDEAEYLLIADNEERRQADDDPIRKARRAKFLERYWDIHRGGNRKSKGQNVPLINQKNLNDVANAIGEDERTTKRLIKLNDLIPEIQSLVSAGKFGTTAAEQLAHLTPEVQADLYKAMGDSLADLTVAETKELRKQLQDREAEKAWLAGELEQAKQEAKAAEDRLAEVEEELAQANREFADLQDRVEDLKEEARAEAQKEIAEREERIRKLLDAKKKADAHAIERTNYIADLNAKLREAKAGGTVVEKPVRYAEDIQRIHQLEKELQEKEDLIRELRSNGNQDQVKELEKQVADLRQLCQRLQHEAAKKKSVITFLDFTRDSLRPLEKAEEQIKRLACGDLDGQPKLDVTGWIGLLKRVTVVLEGVLATGGTGEADVIDIVPRLGKRGDAATGR